MEEVSWCLIETALMQRAGACTGDFRISGDHHPG